ncbi:MAG: M28 family peptidase [Syntrophomonadaceae bacterium]|nr:M28 family peptidase [Syntrophomonadaceae bacterium]
MKRNLNEQINNDLTELCVTIGDRHPGSEKNRRASSYVSKRLASAGFSVSEPELECIDWECGDIIFKIGEESIQGFIGPYSRSCEIKSHFKAVASIDDLAEGDFSDKILVLYGEICKEQLAAKGFTFYNPDHHKKMVALLEQKNPLAVIAITGRNPATTGAMSPFPLIEDGDFDIPSAYISEEEGQKILDQPEKEIYLFMESIRIPSKACNVIGIKKGQTLERIVFCAHIDSKKGTPGALDNGGGVCLLLALADLLKEYNSKYTIELLTINGEDYYAYPGGMKYLEDNQGLMDQIILAVNADGAGSKGSRTTYCFFNSSETISLAVKHVFKDSKNFAETEPWYQSDHAIFALNGIPAIALTTEDFSEIWATIAHTSMDTIDKVDIDILAVVACALRELIDELNHNKLT